MKSSKLSQSWMYLDTFYISFKESIIGKLKIYHFNLLKDSTL